MTVLRAALIVFFWSGLVWGHGAEHQSSSVADREQQPWGIAGDPAAVTRTITVRMLDTMRFVPDAMEVRLGETVRIVAVNEGVMMHEFVLGTRVDNEKHAELMRIHPGMEHDEAYMAHVPPGQRGEIIWTFNRAGTFEFACLIVGHYQAGMFGILKVVG